MTDASRLAVLLGARVRLVRSLLAPCAAGASVISVRHRIYEQDHSENHFAGRPDADPVREHPPQSYLMERLRQAVLRQIWQDTDDLATTDRRLGLLPEFYVEEIGMVFHKNLQ